MSESEATLAALVDRLAKLRTLGQAPREELEWLASHGTVEEFDAGHVVTGKGEPIDTLYVVLSGRIAIFVDRGAGRHKLMEWKAGDITGILPYSRLKTPPGDTVVQEPTAVLAIDREYLRSLTRECHEITSILVHIMLDRARHFTSSALQDERMISLGKLSAGLAHELNNPASAIERNALLLGERLEDAEEAARLLVASRLTEEQFSTVDAARESCVAMPVRGVRSPLEAAEREEALGGWLEGHGLDAEPVESLAESSVSVETLEGLATAVQGAALNAALRWIAACCAVRRLAQDIQDAALRISGLVMAIKGFTRMDQAELAQPFDLTKGLHDTVAVLRSKARAKSVAVVLEVAPDLPAVQGFAGELNQVWGNLIDNALDVVPQSGRVEIKASRDDDRVAVRVIDNGGGIPDEIREHIFEPFFTTKPVGQGTGLGLDIVRRLVVHNGGDVAVESRPGRTEFRVLLPIAAAGSTS